MRVGRSVRVSVRHLSSVRRKEKNFIVKADSSVVKRNC